MLKHQIRMKGDGKLKEVMLSPNRAIRCFCLECAGWRASEVRKCSDPYCGLFLYRFGTNPARKGRQKELGKIGKKGPILS